MNGFKKWINEGLWDNLRDEDREEMSKILSGNSYENFILKIKNEKIIEISRNKEITSLLPFIDEFKKMSNSYFEYFKFTIVKKNKEILYCFICPNSDQNNCKKLSKDIAQNFIKEL
jgi:hypothetical protein